MRIPEEYQAKLKKKRRNVYISGDLVDRDDERMMGSIRILSKTFELAGIPEQANKEKCSSESISTQSWADFSETHNF